MSMLKKAFAYLALSCLSFSAMFAQEKDVAVMQARTHAVKFEFFSPLTGNVTFAYEKSLQQNLSLEAAVGISGLGVQVGDDMKAINGGFIRFGPKMRILPDFLSTNDRSIHPLHGFYFKPTLTYSYVTRRFHHYYYDYQNQMDYDYYLNENAHALALTLNFGKQIVMVDRVTMDFNIGLGYGYVFQNHSFDGQRPLDYYIYEDYYSTGYYYSHSFVGNEFPLAINCGFSVGYLIR